MAENLQKPRLRFQEKEVVNLKYEERDEAVPGRGGAPRRRAAPSMKGGFFSRRPLKIRTKPGEESWQRFLLFKQKCLDTFISNTFYKNKNIYMLCKKYGLSYKHFVLSWL